MMKWIITLLISVSFVVAALTSQMDEVSNSAIESGTKAVNLTLSLIGSMGMWGGIMRIADKAGVCDMIAKALSPLTKRLFKDIKQNGKAFKAITMNITANLLGLGNAATPLGLEAMKQLEAEENSETPHIASRNMIMLAVINSASIQLLPTTVATLRLAHGAQNPLDVLPSILLVSVISLAVGIILVFTLDNKTKKKGRK